MSTAASGAGSGAGGQARLESWKSISSFLRVNERTAKRWEKERGLPVHRLPGESRSCVFAYVTEIETWRNSSPETHPGSAEKLPAPSMEAFLPGAIVDRTAGSAERALPLRRFGNARWWIFGGRAAALILMAVGGERGLLRKLPEIVAIDPATLARGHVPPSDAQELYLRGRYYWNLRTAESLATAIDAYTQAIVRDPNYAEAYAGLAEAYDLLPQFGRADLGEALKNARTTADRALALNPNLAEAHAAKGFALFYWDWDISGSDAEFLRALALDPDSGLTHQWYASTLDCRNDGPGALREIEAARRLNPTSAAISADAALFHAEFGDYAAGMQALREIERTQPTLASPVWFLESLDFATGDFPGFIAEARHYASVTQSPRDAAFAEAVGQGWARGGRLGLLQAQLTVMKASFNGSARSNYDADTGFRIGQILLLLGRSQDALPWFRAALEHRCIGLITMEDCPWGKPLERDTGYRALFADIRAREHGAPAHPAVVRVGIRLPQ